jgi:hypothetical protein
MEWVFIERFSVTESGSPPHWGLHREDRNALNLADPSYRAGRVFLSLLYNFGHASLKKEILSR